MDIYVIQNSNIHGR